MMMTWVTPVCINTSRSNRARALTPAPSPSTWFPLIDRNPQKFVPNIFEAKAEDFQAATQRIYRSREAPSHLVLPVR